MKDYSPERYFICSKCGKMTTQEEIDCTVSTGGQNSCYCEYITFVWDGTRKALGPRCVGIFNSWKEISPSIFHALRSIDNDVERVRAFLTIPEEDL